MTLEFVVLLLAAAQAFLLAVLAFRKRRALYANRFLSWLMLACGIAVLHMLLQDHGFYARFPQLLHVVLGIPFVVAPLYFLYAKYLITRRTSFARADWLHFFLPATVETVVLVTALISPAAFAEPSTNNVALVPLQFHVYNWVLNLQGIVYTLACLSLLRAYRGTIKNVVSSMENVRLNWLMFLTLAAFAAWLSFLVESALLLFGYNLSNFVLTSICGGLYVYAVGYYGVIKSEVLAEPVVGNIMHEVSDTVTETKRAGEKYQRSGLDRETAAVLAGQLLTLMDEKRPYRDASLTLAQLAAMLSITPHNLSEVINTQYGKNFYDSIRLS